MVQGYDEEDLGRRFSRVEQLRLERRRREKVQPLSPCDDQLVDRCRRVLFEPDQNIQGWIDGELGKIADVNRQEWNFDFRRGTPADIPGHKWEWEQLNVARGPPSAVKNSSPWAAAAACQPKDGPRSSKLSKTAKARRNTLQTKITDYMCQRRYPTSMTSTKSLKASSVGRLTANAEEMVLLPTRNQ